jgi:hypothetical protein
MRMRYLIPTVCAVFLGAMTMAPATARARDFCVACSYPDYYCVLITSAGYLKCTNQGGRPCLLEGPCQVTSVGTKFDILPDGAVRVRSSVEAVLASAERGTENGNALTTLRVSGTSGRRFVRACGDVIVSRHYSPAAQTAIQEETRTMAI